MGWKGPEARKQQEARSSRDGREGGAADSEDESVFPGPPFLSTETCRGKEAAKEKAVTVQTFSFENGIVVKLRTLFLTQIKH